MTTAIPDIAAEPVPFEPVPADADPAVERFTEVRGVGLRRFAALLRDRLGPPDAACLAAAVDAFDALDRTEQRDLVTQPAYGYWWSLLSRAIGVGDAAAAGDLVPHLSRCLIAPLTQMDLADPLRLTLPPAPSGRVRLPGLPGWLPLPGFYRPTRVTAEVGAGRLRLTDGTAVREVTIADLRAGRGMTRPGGTVAGTAIEVDATDPWAVEFLAQENVAHPSPGRTRDDMRPVQLSGTGLARLGDTVGLVRATWPAMADEIAAYVRLIVPFSSQVRAAFTNVAWHGAVFLRDTLDDEVANVERLVHEASHLRLNLVMAQARLLDHSPADTVPSPFRAGPRPVMGLFHGAFVVTRAAVALDRAYRRVGGAGYPQRIPILLAQVGRALETLRREVRMTAPGGALAAAIEDQVTRLAATYGVADHHEPHVYDDI